ncbi:MAG: hypothetical protein F6K40_08665 [Okeania sp. SIO3I5]|uniref:hypothetical protein n=1 Tax=Okeania sp. SIO3I5 TaxID=2607805 RepID=UPI0013BAEE2E|nr:hypothetical protein [Okeania sp. SIO3I5]NEQ36348.1 hypothetical protein [Okeania sp. SIO3I5]
MRNTEYLRGVKFTVWLPYVVNKKEYEINQFALENLKLIKEICQKNKIKLIAFITPPHASHVEALYIAGFGHVIPEIKRQIVKVIPVWDFYGYNSITTEPLDRVKNYRDSAHIIPDVGDLILSRILSYQEQTVPADFGIMITPDNIEFEIAKMQVNRESWGKQNTKTIEYLRSLVK